MIKVKGKIAGIDVDLEIDGLSQELFKQFTQLVSSSSATLASSQESTELSHTSDNQHSENGQLTNSPPYFPVAQQSAQLALQYLKEHGDTSSSVLIDYLSSHGCSDQEIKKSLMALRESDDVRTYKSDDGQQRFYQFISKI
ncbi:hypothetical protein [Sessilibacter sp. MAH2]